MKTKKINKTLLVCLFAFLTFFSSIQPVLAKMSTGWYVIIDDSSYMLQGYIVEDDTGSFSTHEEKLSTGYQTDCSHIVFDGSTGNYDYNSLKTPSGSSCKTIKKNKNNTRSAFAWTWPPNLSTDRTARDIEQANWVNEILVTSYNQAIYTAVNGNDEIVDDEAFEQLIMALSQDAYSAAHSGSAIITHIPINRDGKKVAQYSYKISRVTKEELTRTNYTLTKGWTEADISIRNTHFIKIVGLDDKGNEVTSSLILPYRVPKGYAKGQILGNEKSDETITYPEYISWSHVAHQAIYSNKQGINAANTDEIFNPSSFEKTIVKFFDGIFNGLTGIFGMYSIEELTLNRGTRAVSYWKGLMPRSWFTGASLVFWVFQVASLFVLIGGLLKVMAQKSLSVAIPGKRVEMSDTITKMVFAVLIMLLFYPLFTLLAVTNEMIVGIFDAMVPNDSTLSFSVATNATFAAILVSFAFMFVKFKMNITYIVRSLTILILFATAPLFISFYPMGSSGKERFETWLRELIANIFMQSFNAILTALMLIVLKYSSLRVIESLALLLAYTSLCDYFKNTLMGASSGTDRIDDRVTGGIAGTFGVAAAGLLSSKKSGKASASAASSASSGDTSGNGYGEAEVMANTQNNTSMAGKAASAINKKGLWAATAGGIGNAASKVISAGYDKVAGNGQKAQATKKVIAEGAKYIGGVASGVAKTSMAAGVMMGSSAADVKGLTWVSKNVKDSVSDLKDSFSFKDKDFFPEGEVTGEGNGLYSSQEMSQNFGIHDAKNGTSQDLENDNRGRLLRDGEMSSYSEEVSLFDDDENGYDEYSFDKGSTAYANLNSNDSETREAAMKGISEMNKDVPMEYITKPLPKDKQGNIIKDSYPEIIGIRRGKIPNEYSGNNSNNEQPKESKINSWNVPNAGRDGKGNPTSGKVFKMENSQKLNFNEAASKYQKHRIENE